MAENCCDCKGAEYGNCFDCYGTGHTHPADTACPAWTLEEHAKAVRVDLMMPDSGGGYLAEAYGAMHRIEVCENENLTGWIVSVSSPLGAANIEQDQAEFFARLLMTGGSGDRST